MWMAWKYFGFFGLNVHKVLSIFAGEEKKTCEHSAPTIYGKYCQYGYIVTSTDMIKWYLRQKKEENLCFSIVASVKAKHLILLWLL